MAREEKYRMQPEILHNLDYEAISGTVSKDSAGTITDNGRKVLPAGTLVTGVTESIFNNRRQLVTQTEGSAGTIDGVTLYDVDITNDDAEVAIVYVGTVWANEVQVEVTDAIRKALPRITFVQHKEGE